MTREEAIKTLKGEAWICCAEKWNEALDMAIKALEFIDKLHQIKTDYNDYKISQDERIKVEAHLFKEMGI